MLKIAVCDDEEYFRKRIEAGCPRLKTVTKPWLQKYLKKMDMKPFKIKYYLERKGPDFENKMHDNKPLKGMITWIMPVVLKFHTTTPFAFYLEDYCCVSR